MKRYKSRRCLVHLLNYKAPTPKCERSVCGLSLGNIAFTTDEKRVTCKRCRR